MLRNSTADTDDARRRHPSRLHRPARRQQRPAVSRPLLTTVGPTRVRRDCAQTTRAVTPRCCEGR
ncbi:hypothetical protein DRA43_01375 [Micromonospora provocatoris]|nr:hypothetical protein DRA43_01375 [Micromonospora provocatoris]